MDGERQKYEKILDRYLIHKRYGIPLFLIIMFMVFQLTFTLAQPFVTIIEKIFSYLAEASATLLSGSPHWLISLISDSIIGGIGSVIVFFPNIFILFFLIDFLEKSGYIARASYALDSFMSYIGLNSRSFIPLIIGFGCNVPAILAARTITDKKDRILTILITPFISCSARLPIYVLFTSIFFSRHEGLVIFSVYMIGIITAILAGFILKNTIFKGSEKKLHKSLPEYKLPKISSILKHTWLETKMFIKKAGTVIFAAVIVVWLLSNLPMGVEHASKESFIGAIGNFIAPIFSPLGFGFWEAAVALIFGLIAKEIVIGTLGAIYGEAALGGVLASAFTPLSAYAFMVFVLLYIPCIPTLETIRKETSFRWMVFSSLFLLTVAYIITFLIYQGGLLFQTLFSI